MGSDREDAEGIVERISPVVDRESLTVEVLTRFPDAAVLLRPGSFVHVDIITRILENRIVVPRAALLASDGRSRIFRLLEDGEIGPLFLELQAVAVRAEKLHRFLGNFSRAHFCLCDDF